MQFFLFVSLVSITLIYIQSIIFILAAAILLSTIAGVFVVYHHFTAHASIPD
jgi:hypothetical protein